MKYLFLFKIRKNAKPKGFKQKLRRKLKEIQKDKNWKKRTGYNKRTASERRIYAIKRTIGDFVNSKKYHLSNS